jgi:hypothetical protein
VAPVGFIIVVGMIGGHVPGKMGKNIMYHAIETLSGVVKRAETLP